MSKTKWHTRAIYLVVALVMTIGLLVAPAAAPQDSEVAASPDTTFRLVDQNLGFGTACWDDSKHKEGTSSVELVHTANAGSVYVSFVPEPGITLADLDDIVAASEWSFWHNTPAVASNWAQLELVFTMPCGYDPATGVGRVELTLMPLQGFTGDGTWVKQTFVATDKPAWVYYGTDPVDGTGFDNHPGEGMGVKAISEIEGDINGEGVMITDHGASASDWELTRVRVDLWEAGARTCNIDDVTIAGTKYEVEQGPDEYYLEPDIAYNVKTAQETFTVIGPCGPLVEKGPPPTDPAPLAYVVSWSVEKGCGVPGGGPVTIVAGGDDADGPPITATGDNYVTVRLNTQGDCHICVMIDKNTDEDGDPTDTPADLVEVCAEKKWGDIHCTELTKGALVGGECCVTEYVEASFLWEGCVIEVELPADGAVVDWWLMDIGALAAVTALETELGVDPCDVDGGCGTYTPGFFVYDVDGNAVDETYNTPGAAMAAIYTEWDDLAKATNFIAPDTNANETHEQTTSGVDGKTSVSVTLAAPTSAILVTLTDYPIDRHGQNTVCVQHETWVVIPPPVMEKLPQIAWAGEKVVLEWDFGTDYKDKCVRFVKETKPNSPGTFVGAEYGADIFETTVDAYGIARAIYLSDTQGQVDIDVQLFFGTAECTGSVIAEQGIIIYYLELAYVELVNVPTEDMGTPWTADGATSETLNLGESTNLRARVHGWFFDHNYNSWTLPDDWRHIASSIHWNVMDTPTDDVVSELDTTILKAKEVGPYLDAPCTGDTVAENPVIGPFSLLEPAIELGWDVTQQPAVPADATVAGLLRTTVVPDAYLDEFDAIMPPAELTFWITDGKGTITSVDKGDIYVKSQTCDSTSGVIYTNPYYKQEIPANSLIDPLYGAGRTGYEWDSWGREGIPAIDGPYDFFTSLMVWPADYMTANLNFGLGLTAADNPALKVYTDNHGEAWGKFTMNDVGTTIIRAIADYPYETGKGKPIISDEVTKIAVSQKVVKVAWEPDEDYPATMNWLYVFVRNYDGEPALEDTVDWLLEAGEGSIRDILATGTVIDESHATTTVVRMMDATELAHFGTAMLVSMDSESEQYRKISATGTIPLFATGEDPEDFIIAGIKVSSSLKSPVDIVITIHDYWNGEFVEDVFEDQILYFGNVEPPEEDILDYYRDLDGDATDVSTSDLLAAITDWAAGTPPSGFTEALTTTELLTLITEWAAS